MPASDQGILSDRYAIIPRTLIFVVQAGRVLLIKGAQRKRLWAGLFNGVGGHIERGEDVLTAARRELLEETGLNVEALWLCGTVIVDAGAALGVGIFVLRGEKPHGELHPSPEGDLEWVAFDRLDSLPMVEDLSFLLPRVLASKRGQPPFSARSHYDNDQHLTVQFSA